MLYSVHLAVRWKKNNQKVWHPGNLSNSTLLPPNGTEATPSMFILESYSKKEFEFKVLCLCVLGFNVVVFFLFLSLPWALDSAFSAITQQTRPSAFRPCSKLTKRAVLHMTSLLLKTACVFLLMTAQQSPCNPAFLWLVSTWVFYTSPYSSIRWRILIDDFLIQLNPKTM